jgi:hypothetical protein
MNNEPTPNPNIEDRLKKIQAAQQEISNMTPSPEQIAYEQLLEMHAANQKSAAETKTALALARTEIPAAVETALEDHRTQMRETQDASERRIVAAVVAKLTPRFTNKDVIDRINLWCPVNTAILVLGICVLIVLIVRH